MARLGFKTLFLPIMGLLAAAVVLLGILTATTYMNLDRAATEAERALAAQGSAVVSGLAAGLRTGWKFWTWREDSLQGLMQEITATTSEVDFIALLDEKGRVLAHSNPELVGKILINYQKLLSPLAENEIKGWFQGEKLYLTGRKIPEEKGRIRMSMFSMGRNMIIERYDEGSSQPTYILAGLKTDSYHQAKTNQLNQALFMSALIFLVGLGAIYLIFVLQNYRTIDRTLKDLSTYTSGIVDNMPNGLITLDASGQPVMINQAARIIFGWQGREIKSIAQSREIGELTKFFLPLLRRENPIIEREFTISADSGNNMPIAVSAASTPIEDRGASQLGTILIIRDLSRLMELEEQVRRTEKLAAVGQLAAGIAHEVRNPLSSMRGLARFLAKDLDEKSREAEYLSVMVSEIDRLNRVVTGLLDFARPRVPELAKLDLSEAARHSIGLVADEAEHQGVEIEARLAQGPVQALADRDQVVQVVLNLLLNAIEVMEEGGKITVSTWSEPGRAALKIQDTGPGISEEDLPRLFDPFFTTKKQGAGLGLAQSATIMQAHHGRIHVEASLGQGAVFTLYFPAVQAKEGQEEA